MKNIRKRNYVKQITYIIIIMLMLCNFILPNYSYATTDEDSSIFSEDITFSVEHVASGSSMPYLLYTPSSATEGKKTPLIVWLHGSGEVGGSLGQLLISGLPYALGNCKLEGFNAYVLCPQLTSKDISWNKSSVENKLKTLLDEIIDEYNIDTNNIIIMGHSLGGQGAIYMAYHLQEYFSKCVVMSGYNPNEAVVPGGGTDNPIGDLSEITMPVRSYVETGKDMYAAFKQAFGAPISVSGDHGSVPRLALNQDEDGNNRSDLIEWIFEDYEETVAASQINVDDDWYDVTNDDTGGGGILLEAIAKFVCFVPDTVMEYMQHLFADVDDIKQDDGTYSFKYSPAIIFSGTVPAFDINFVNPGEAKVSTATETDYISVLDALELGGATQEESSSILITPGSFIDEMKTKYGFEDSAQIDLDELKEKLNSGETNISTEVSGINYAWYNETENKVYVIVTVMTMVGSEVVTTTYRRICL